MNVSYYKNAFDKDGAEVDLEAIFDGIKSGKWMQDVQLIRGAKTQKKKDEFKKNLPCFTPAGVFGEGQTIDGITECTFLIVLDVDPDIVVSKDKKIPQVGTLEEWCAKIKADPFTHAMFISPSGKGVKFLVPIDGAFHTEWDSLKDVYYDAFEHISAYYMDNYEIVLDRSGKNINRLCFVSYDEDAFINDHIPYSFRVDKIDRSKEFTKSYDGYEADDVYGIMNISIKCVNLHQQFGDSNRNNYIYELSCTLNRFGVSFEDTLHLVDEYFTLDDVLNPKSEWYKSINSAYKHHAQEHGSVTAVIPDGDVNKPDLLIGNETDLYDTAKEVLNKIKSIDKAKELMVGYYSNKYMDIISKQRAMFILKKAFDDNMMGLGLSNIDSKVDYIINVVGGDKVKSIIPQFSAEMRGGYTPGKSMCLIGTEGSYKTWFAMNEAINSAKMGYPTAYFNLEMSDFQFLIRLALIVLHRDIDAEITVIRNAINYPVNSEEYNNELNSLLKPFIKELYLKIDEILNGNLKMYSEQGLSEDDIAKLFQRYYVETGKNIRLAVIDGIWGLKQSVNDEIKSAMVSASAIKKLANDTNSTIIALSHSKTGVAKHIRNQHEYVLGGRKILSNFDSFISLSLCINNAETDWDNADFRYRRDVVFLRSSDRRDGIEGQVDVIANISKFVEFEATDDNPRNYEVKKDNGAQGTEQSRKR